MTQSIQPGNFPLLPVHTWPAPGLCNIPCTIMVGEVETKGDNYCHLMHVFHDIYRFNPDIISPGLDRVYRDVHEFYSYMYGIELIYRVKFTVMTEPGDRWGDKSKWEIYTRDAQTYLGRYDETKVLWEIDTDMTSHQAGIVRTTSLGPYTAKRLVENVSPAGIPLLMAGDIYWFSSKYPSLGFVWSNKIPSVTLGDGHYVLVNKE